jgi:hypothetical protein
MRKLPAAGWRGAGRAMALWLLLALVAGPAAAAGPAGQFRLLLEGEAGVRNEGDYGRVDGVQGGQDQQDQAVGRAGLNLQLSYQKERLELAMGYSPSYERGFRDSARLSGLSHRLDFGLNADLTRRLKLSARERLFSSPTLDLYVPSQAETTVATRQGDQLVHSLDVELANAVSSRVSIRAGVSQGIREYRGSNLADSRELLGRLGASFALDRGQSVEVAADAGRYDYGDRGEADVRSFGLAWATDLGRSSHLRLEGGAYSVDSTLRFTDVEGAPVFVGSQDQGWRGNAQFSQERRLFRWAVGLAPDVSPGAGLGRAAQADNVFLGISTTVVGRQLTLGLDANGSRQREIAGDSGVRTGTDPSLIDYAAGTAHASWSFGPALRLDGGYSRVWQRSRVEPFPDLSYGRYFLNLAFRIYRTGETPREPDHLGEPTTDEQPDAQ